MPRSTVPSAAERYRQADEVGRFGDANEAFELSANLVRKALRARDRDLLPRCVAQLVRHAWTAARYPDALPYARAYLRSPARRTPSSPYHMGALLSCSHMLATLGDVEQAIVILDEAEALDLHVPVDDFVRLLHQRAFATGLLGFDDEAVALYRRAAEIARRRRNPDITPQTLNNFASHLRQTGHLQEALALHDEVIAFVKHAGIYWRAQYYLLSQSLTYYYGGQLAKAEKLYEEVAATPPANTQVEILLGSVGYLLGVAMGRPQFLTQHANSRFVEKAFTSREPIRIASAVVAKHRHLIQINASRDAQELLARALDIVEIPYTLNLVFLEVAAHGNRQIVQRSLEIVQRMYLGSPVRQAFTHLLRARLERLNDDIGAEHDADRAALLFDRLAWPIHRAVALEVAGRFREAMQLYQSCGATVEAARARSRRHRRGRPRRVRGQLTTREWEVAKLCVGGLRNSEIAERLGVALKTVEFHVRNILRELDLTSRYDLRDALAELR